MLWQTQTNWIYIIYKTISLLFCYWIRKIRRYNVFLRRVFLVMLTVFMYASPEIIVLLLLQKN